jgi:hypothetical protein
MFLHDIFADICQFFIVVSYYYPGDKVTQIRHSCEGRDPEIDAGCRIKSGMTG